MKINLLIGVILFFFSIPEINAQVIGLSGPTTTIPSGGIITFTATGETSKKVIGNVPTYGSAVYGTGVFPNVSCSLSETNYYTDKGNQQAGKFSYKLVNGNSVAKTVVFSFSVLIVISNDHDVRSYEYKTINCTVTVGPSTPPVAPVTINPATLTKITNMGFATDGIVEFSDYYLVEDDIMLSKSYVNSLSGIPTPVNITNHNINIIIDQSIWANPLWDDAVIRAALAWNSQTYSNIKVNIVKDAGNNFAQPSTIDIKIIQSSDPVKVPVFSRFTINDGKPGNQILFNPNFLYPGTSSTVSYNQATWNLVQAIGHCLGIKHASGTGSASSVMLRGTASSSYNNNLTSSYDSQVIGAKYPFNASSQVIPFIFGKNTLHPYETANFEMRYYEAGITYKWKVVGINGTVYNEEYIDYTETRLPEVYFPTGNYQIQCTIIGGKYTIPATATKNIIVQ